MLLCHFHQTIRGASADHACEELADKRDEGGPGHRKPEGPEGDLPGEAERHPAHHVRGHACPRPRQRRRAGSAAGEILPLSSTLKRVSLRRGGGAGRGGVGTGHDGDGEQKLRDAEDDGGDDPHLAAAQEYLKSNQITGAARYCKATRDRLVR